MRMKEKKEEKVGGGISFLIICESGSVSVDLKQITHTSNVTVNLVSSSTK